MSENGEPDWLAELAKGGEALRRQAEAIVQAAGQFAASSPAQPLAQRITRAVGELLSAPKRPVAHQAPAGLAVAVGTAAAAATATVTASGSVALHRIGVAGTVQNPPSGTAEWSVGQYLALVLVVIMTARLLAVSGPDQATVGYDLTVLGDALTIAMIIWNWNKTK
jgi:hypothetical protein